MPTDRMLVAAATAAMLASMDLMGEGSSVKEPPPKRNDHDFELDYANRAERRAAERGTKKRGRHGY